MSSATSCKNVAVVLAGGKGLRFGHETPKQFIKLAGKLIIEHTIDVFENSPKIDEIIIIAQFEFHEKIWQLVQTNLWHKVKVVADAGDERFHSTLSALKTLAKYPEETKVLLHDAVRPFVTPKIIEDALNALNHFQAVNVVIPSSDTIVAIHDNGSIANIPNRATMRRGQTPQGFRLHTLRAAYAKAEQEQRFQFTCDCGVVRAMLPHLEVTTVMGSEQNIKITHPIDLFLAEKLIQSQSVDLLTEKKSWQEITGKHIVIFGGSSGIGEALAQLLRAHQARVTVTSASLGVDIANLTAVQTFLNTTEQQFGKIDAIVNTAGILIKKPLATTCPSEITNSINTNYLGAVNIAYAAFPYLSRSHGMLLNFTSSSYTRGRANYALYTSSKCAIVNLTQALAEEWNPSNVRVNCINPERTHTPMRTKNFGDEPLNTLLSAETVAEYSLSTLLCPHTGIIVDVRR